MKRMFVILAAAALVLAPYIASVNAQSSTSQPPPIQQPLVSEGEFAVELATALNLTSSHDEAAAEDSLAKINIAPRNGWISDYPMTPDILAEVRDSAARSASAKSLNMSEADATSTVDSVGSSMNLPIKVSGENSENSTYESSSSSSSENESSSEYQSGSAAPPPESPQYVESSDVDEYYDQNGPPVVSYYPPPWDYDYLYTWVPWPFWWDGFGFGGYFILNDFDCDDCGGHHHHHHFSNHFRNTNGTVTRIDPVTRARGVAGAGRSARGSRFGSASGQAGARSIMNRRMSSGAGNPVGTVRAMNRSTSTGRTMGQGAVTRSSSFSGRSFNGSSSGRSFNGGYYHGTGGYHSTGGGYYHSGGSYGGGSYGGGFHGGGGGGGFGGGGGGFHGGGGGGGGGRR